MWARSQISQYSRAADTKNLGRAVTPTTDTNRFGRHDPLSDVRVLSAQVSNYIGQLCGIFLAKDQAELERVNDLSSLRLVFILGQQASITQFLKLPQPGTCDGSRTIASVCGAPG